MTVALWLGGRPPIRSIRWLDGALAAAATVGARIAVAAGTPAWHDLAADRATRAGLGCVGVACDLQLDYLGWAQVMAAIGKKLGATTILVDEASRPERFAEVAAIAELTDAAQLTGVVGLTAGPAGLIARRAPGSAPHTVHVRGAAVIGLRIAGPPIEEYPTPTPSAAMRRLQLAELGLDPAVLAHRAVAPQSEAAAGQPVERICELLAAYAAPRGDG